MENRGSKQDEKREETSASTLNAKFEERRQKKKEASANKMGSCLFSVSPEYLHKPSKYDKKKLSPRKHKAKENDIITSNVKIVA